MSGATITKGSASLSVSAKITASSPTWHGVMGGFVTAKTIKVDGYKKLFVLLKHAKTYGDSGDGTLIYLSKTKPGTTTLGNHIAPLHLAETSGNFKSVEIDISKATGTLYFVMRTQIQKQNGNDSANSEIKKIWLER